MPSHAPYLLHAGRIIDGTGKPPIENAALLFHQGKIQYAGPSSQAPADSEAIVINAPELTVMPGLIDGNNICSGALKNIPFLRGYLKYGVTTMMGISMPHHEEPPVQSLRDSIEAKTLPGSANLVAGNMITCTNGRYPAFKADGPWEIRRAVRKMAENGAEFIATASNGNFGGPGNGEGVHFLCYTQEELNALVDEAHAWNLPIAVHAMTQPGLNHAIEAGADIIMHGCFIDSDAIEKIAEKNLWYMPTLIITCPRTIENLKKYPGMHAKKQAAIEIHRTGVNQAIKAGVRLCLGGHGMGFQPHWNYGEATTFELSELVRCGLTSLEAITTGTLATAKAFRIADRVGSLEVGKDADLFCIQGNPLEDIELLQRQEQVAMVFKKGNLQYARGDYAQLMQSD